MKITPLSPEESKTAVERQVVIVGTPESQWKAQYYIYEKIRQERFATDDNVKLRAEIQVPAHIVGRIIGKSGKNVRELQRTTGATIKLPEDGTQQQGTTGSEGAAEEGAATTSTNENDQQGGANKEETAATNETASSEAATVAATNDQSAAAPAEQDKESKEAGNNKPASPDMSPNASASNANATANQNGGSNTNFVTGMSCHKLKKLSFFFSNKLLIY